MVLKAPKLVREGECENEDGDELYFSDFLDGDQGECPLRYEVEVSDFEFYEAVEEEGVSNCEELERDAALETFLENQCSGAYRIDAGAYRDIMVSNWWVNVHSISFAKKEDANLFEIAFG